MHHSSSRPLARLLPALGLVVALGACGRIGPRPAPPAPRPTTPAPVSRPAPSASTANVPSMGCTTRRTGPADGVGCYVAATAPFGVAGAAPIYWYIDEHENRASAEAVKGTRGTVAEAHGRAWLFTLAPAGWKSSAGERVARVGPLPLVRGRRYAAHYAEAVVPPGGRMPVHLHPGPEAWYVLEGSQCVETAQGARVVRARESLVVPAGRPMLLATVGTTVRRTLAVVLHEASQPWTIPTTTWTPPGKCPR